MRRERKYYYGILGLNPGASNAEVKSAYRRLVRLYHPDKDPSPDSEVMYKEIRTAYDKLMNWDNIDSVHAEPIYQPPKRAAQTASKSNVNSDWKVAWHTVETAHESHYRVNRIPFEFENIPVVFASSLHELSRAEIFAAFTAFGFVFIPIIGKPYAFLASLFYIISWIMFVFFRYYFALSLPFYKRLLFGIWYGLMVGFLIACFYVLTKLGYAIIFIGATIFILLLTAGLREK